MAGPSKTYRRKTTTPQPVVRTRINTYGREETYLEWNIYEANHIPGQHVMDEQGMCISNPGMDSDYYIQGPGQVLKSTNNDVTTFTYADPNGKQGTYNGDTGTPK
jgi:hypothetical protein